MDFFRISKTWQAIKKALICDNLFGINRIMLEEFGYWPENNLINWKVMGFFTSIVCFTVIPKIVLISKESSDLKSFTRVFPEFMISLGNIYATANILLTRKELKKFVVYLQKQWYSDDCELFEDFPACKF